MQIKKTELKKLTGRIIYTINKKAMRISGKLVRISGNKLYIRPASINNKQVQINAIIPLVLFDLLAIGTSPYGYGYPYGYGVGSGYYGGYPGVGYYGYPGFY